MVNSTVKKIIFTLLIGIITFSIPYSVLGQISYTSSDLPSVNDTIRTSTSIVLPGLDYTSTGANYVWDFSSLIPLTQAVDTFVSVSSTPFLYQLIFIPNIVANLAQPISNFDSLFPMTGLDVTDIFRFFKKSTSSYQDVGFAVTFENIPLPIKYNSPDVIYKLPLNFGNQDSSFSGFQIGVPEFGYLGVDRKRVNIVDGWGTVITPFGSFNSLRLKSTIYETDTFYIDTAGYGQSLTREIIEYKWLANGKKLPVIQFTETSGIATVTFIDSLRQITVGIKENPDKEKIEVFPNPASDCITIKAPGINEEMNIELIAPDGRIVRRAFRSPLVVDDRYNFETGNLPGGLYIIRVSTQKHQRFTKLIIK